MQNHISILDIITNIDRDKLHDWLNKEFVEGIQKTKAKVINKVDELESSIKKAKDRIDEKISIAKEHIHEQSKKHHDETIHFFQHLFSGTSSKTINIKDIDIVSMFSELTSKGKISQDRAKVYVNEWEKYVKEQSKSKNLIKKHILVVMSLLFLEMSLPRYGEAEMLKMSDGNLENLTGQSGIAVTTQINNDKKLEKKYDFSNLSESFAGFLRTMKDKINNHEIDNVTYDINDLVQDFDSIDVESPFGTFSAKDVKVSGKGKVRIETTK